MVATKVHRHGVARITLAASICLSVIVLSSCGPEKGNTGGRMDPSSSTRADELDQAISAPTLIEYSEKVAEALVDRIASIEEIKNSPTKVVILIGALENRTHTPAGDFYIAQRRVLAELTNSDIVRAEADILEAPETMNAQRERLGPPDLPDRLNEGTATSQGVHYDPEITYLLNGFFGESTRSGGVRSYYFSEMTLTHLASNRRVFLHEFDSSQIRR